MKKEMGTAKKKVLKRRKVAEGIDPRPIGSKRALDVALRLAMDRGEDTVVYDVRSITPLYDYVILTTGASEKRLKSLTEEAEVALRDNHFEVGNVEGKRGSSWFLVDGRLLVVHAFLPEVRREVDLEGMYQSLPKREITEKDLKTYATAKAEKR